MVRASDSQCRSRNCPGFDPSILGHSGISGAADETVLNIAYKKEKNPKKYPFITKSLPLNRMVAWHTPEPHDGGLLNLHDCEPLPLKSGGGVCVPETSDCAH